MLVCLCMNWNFPDWKKKKNKSEWTKKRTNEQSQKKTNFVRSLIIRGYNKMGHKHTQFLRIDNQPCTTYKILMCSPWNYIREVFVILCVGFYLLRTIEKFIECKMAPNVCAICGSAQVANRPVLASITILLWPMHQGELDPRSIPIHTKKLVTFWLASDSVENCSGDVAQPFNGNTAGYASWECSPTSS